MSYEISLLIYKLSIICFLQFKTWNEIEIKTYANILLLRDEIKEETLNSNTLVYLSSSTKRKKHTTIAWWHFVESIALLIIFNVLIL